MEHFADDHHGFYKYSPGVFTVALGICTYPVLWAIECSIFGMRPFGHPELMETQTSNLARHEPDNHPDWLNMGLEIVTSSKW